MVYLDLNHLWLCVCLLEKQDVHEFLLDNLNNGGMLELMMRYLKVISQKFLVKWPPGLCEVVLSIYTSWRKHSSSLPNPLLRDSNNQHIKVRRLSLCCSVAATQQLDTDFAWLCPGSCWSQLCSFHGCVSTAAAPPACSWAPGPVWLYAGVPFPLAPGLSSWTCSPYCCGFNQKTI